MPLSSSLQITPAAADAPLSPAQLRFNALLRELELARAALADWQAAVDRHRANDRRVLQPLRRSWFLARRAWVLALEACLHQPGWSRAELQTLEALVIAAARGLQQALAGADAELQAVLARHAAWQAACGEGGTDRQAPAPDTAAAARDADDADDAGADDAADRAEPAWAGRRPRHGRHPGARQREAEAQQASRSVREVYRQLASALHPDREPDAGRRGAKTALMQRANVAYAAGDLLALLGLQQEIALADAGPLAQATVARVRHYNQVLAGQLSALQDALAEAQAPFRAALDMPAGRPIPPAKLDGLVSAVAGSLRAAVAQRQAEIRGFSDRAATQRWLKQQRVRLQQRERDDDLC